MILLFVMVINCKYLNPHVCVQNQQHNTIDHLHYDLDISCVIHTDQLTILENVYKCNYIPSSGNLQEKVFMNGAIETRVEEPGVGVEERIKKYGFLNNAIIVEILELLLWYSMVTLHALTVVYILFLRKTVYEI